MYDVKYAPFADSYIGMANGDTYEHLKRWLQQRLRFVDSLYDYAPSYNNDVLTIRANTTEPMTLEIETYTPVYQHLSWYNNQMDKKKIDGKTSVIFTGKAMAETDQEVLIYGGSNIKSIKGITSMNPNRMLIGSATKLIELDAPNCPLLADINANKANLAPHVYLNKVNLSGCPLLGGNLIINQSPLIREIDIRNTNITGLNLPSNLRNLEVLRLSVAIPNLVLNDAGQLHTLEFDEGGTLQSVSMTNCNALKNVTNFNLEDATNVTLNNSYNTTSELYFSKAVNLSVSNMPNLEKVIYTPNSEHEEFDKANIDNAPNYTVSTFNCPKLTTFMTTAPYRESYNNCGVTDEIVYVPDYDNIVNIITSEEPAGGILSPTTGVFTSNTSEVHWCTPNFIEVLPNVDITVNSPSTLGFFNVCFYDENQQYIEGYSISNFISKGFKTPKNCKYLKFQTYSNKEKYQSMEIFSPSSKEEYKKDYGVVKPNEVFEANTIDISNTQFTDVKLLCTTDTNVLKLPQTVKNLIVDSAYDLDTAYLTDGDYDTIHTELYEPYNTDYEGEVCVVETIIDEYLVKNDKILANKSVHDTTGEILDATGDQHCITEKIRVASGSDYTVKVLTTWMYGVEIYEYDIDNKFLGKTKLLDYSNFTMLSTFKDNTAYVIFKLPYNLYNSSYELTYTQTRTPNLTPSASDGSIIQSMYVPSKTVQPASGVWDLKGLELEEYHTFGLNNDIVTNEISELYEFYEFDNVYDVRTNPIVIDESNCKLHIRVVPEESIWLNVVVCPKNGGLEYVVRSQLFEPYDSIIDLSEYIGGTVYIQMPRYFVQRINNDNYFVGNALKPELTMPNRYDEYSIQIKNITIPNEIARYTASDWNTFPTFNSEFIYTYDITQLDNDVYYYSIMADSMDNLPTKISFNGKSNLLTVEYLNADNVTTMSNMFYGCNNLTSLDVSNFDTKNVTNMCGMFYNCNKLTSLDVSNFILRM